MKVRFTTNIDHYRTVSWPVLDFPPRKGEKVKVHPGSYDFCVGRNIPTQLEVVDVIYKHNETVVELWYNETDYKLYTQAGHKLL